MPRVSSAAAAHVGARIKAARVRYSMTHDELAAATGIDSSNIRSYESGRAMPSVVTLVRIADALATTPGEFLDELTLDLFPAEAAVRRVG